MDETEYSANFSNDGTWKETEHEIKENDLPQTVMATLKSNFPDQEIQESEISETTDGTVYEFGIEKNNNESDNDRMEKVVIGQNGKVVKTETETNSEDND